MCPLWGDFATVVFYDNNYVRTRPHLQNNTMNKTRTETRRINATYKTPKHPLYNTGG